MSFTYSTEQWLAYPVEPVFAFFANPANLSELMPPWQDARIDDAKIVPPPSPVRLPGSTRAMPAAMAGRGSRITLSFRPFPLSPFRLTWVADITEFELNSHFTDQQTRGPFAAWKHTHRLRTGDRLGAPHTVVADEVEYRPPLGYLGRLANALFLRQQLEHTFAYRHGRVSELLARQLGGPWPIQQSPSS